MKYSSKCDDDIWRNADQNDINKKLQENIPYTIKFKVPNNKFIKINDIVRGTVEWDAKNVLGDFIIVRSNGMPVYNFCVAVDDAYMKISHVIRAEEHLTNTLRQILVLEAINSTPPRYAHCSLILGKNKQKLSKRHGAISLQYYNKQGYLPNAMINYLANLGFNDGTSQEIYLNPDEIISVFDLNKIVKSSAEFDIIKLKWINSQHIKQLDKNKLYILVYNNMLIHDDDDDDVPLRLVDSDIGGQGNDHDNMTIPDLLLNYLYYNV